MAHTGWRIVEFTGDGSVSEVPSDWVEGGGICYWPPYKPSLMTMAIKNCELRDESWEKFAVSVFPGGIYYDYAMARAKARKAEETSDLQSDMEVTKRKIIPKRYSSSEESGPDQTPRMSQTPRMIQESTSLLPPPPKMMKPVIRSDEIVYPAGPSSSNGGEGSFSRTISPVDAGPSCSTSNSNSNSNAADMKILIEQNYAMMGQLNLQRALLVEALERIKNLETKVGTETAPVPDRKISFFVKHKDLQFPLNSVERVTQLEELLKDNANFQDAVNEFAKFGGANIYDFVKRVLSSVIMHDVALMFSWLGRQGKQPFYKLKLAEVVIDAAEEGKQSTNRKEAESTIQKWLKRACDRKPAQKYPCLSP